MRKILVSLTLVLFLISCGGKKEDRALKPPTTNEEAIHQKKRNGFKNGGEGVSRGGF